MKLFQTKTCISGLACSSYVKSASAAGAEEIITMIQRPKQRCSSILWRMESMTRHNRSHGHPLHPGLAPNVLTLSCIWIQLGQDERVKLTLCASPSLKSDSQRMSSNQQYKVTASNTYASHTKSPGDGRVAKQQVRKHWKL